VFGARWIDMAKSPGTVSGRARRQSREPLRAGVGRWCEHRRRRGTGDFTLLFGPGLQRRGRRPMARHDRRQTQQRRRTAPATGGCEAAGKRARVHRQHLRLRRQERRAHAKPIAASVPRHRCRWPVRYLTAAPRGAGMPRQHWNPKLQGHQSMSYRVASWRRANQVAARYPRGMAASKRLVYSSRGAARIFSAAACSTTTPSFITSTSSLTKRTTARSWLMKT
jgi:hypothetical protein